MTWLFVAPIKMDLKPWIINWLISLGSLDGFVHDVQVDIRIGYGYFVIAVQNTDKVFVRDQEHQSEGCEEDSAHRPVLKIFEHYYNKG